MVDRFQGIHAFGYAEDQVDVIERYHNTILIACGLVAAEPTLGDAPTSFAFASMNRGRNQGRLSPIPPIRRMLDMNRTTYPTRGASEPTGREVSKHSVVLRIKTLRHPRFRRPDYG